MRDSGTKEGRLAQRCIMALAAGTEEPWSRAVLLGDKVNNTSWVAPIGPGCLVNVGRKMEVDLGCGGWEGGFCLNLGGAG